MSGLRIYSVGYAGSGAEDFFRRLAEAGVRTVVDVRLRPFGQLSGFARSPDLAFFLKRLAGIDYRREPLLAPTASLLADWRSGALDWPGYEKRFTALLAERQVEKSLTPADFAGVCLLCSEALPHHCHRRLAAEYLGQHWPGSVALVHL